MQTLGICPRSRGIVSSHMTAIDVCTGVYRRSYRCLTIGYSRRGHTRYPDSSENDGVKMYGMFIILLFEAIAVC